MEASSASYVRVTDSGEGGAVPLLRVPMHRGATSTNLRQPEDLSHSLFFGFDAVLNAREPKIGTMPGFRCFFSAVDVQFQASHQCSSVGATHRQPSLAHHSACASCAEEEQLFSPSFLTASAQIQRPYRQSRMHLAQWKAGMHRIPFSGLRIPTIPCF